MRILYLLVAGSILCLNCSCVNTGVCQVQTNRLTHTDSPNSKSVITEGRRLINAVRNGDLQTVKEMLQSPDRSVSKFGRCGPVNLLTDGCRLGHNEVVTYLLENRVRLEIDLNGRDRDGLTALHHAVHTQNEELVSTLLKAGAGVNPVEVYHGGVYNNMANHPRHLIRTALDFSEGNIHRLLREKGGRTALELSLIHESLLFHAIIDGELEAVKILLKKRPLPLAEKDANVLMFACIKKKDDIVDYLLANLESLGISLRDTDRYGWTALHYAALAGNKKVVLALLNAGAEVNIIARDRRQNFFFGWTALDLTSDEVLSEVLRERGAMKAQKLSSQRIPDDEFFEKHGELPKFRR